jgi:hypothetical protein
MYAKYLVVGVLIGVLVGVFLSSAVVVLAGNLNPPAGPANAASQMVTLEQIYQRLDDGTETAKMTSFTEPAIGPVNGTMHTLEEIYDLIGERAPVPKTGQIYKDADGDDGDLEKGVAWPYPRFTDNLDGTVSDNLTGLIWLKDANCYGSKTWDKAVAIAYLDLADGKCGLSDGSSPEDWRLPNVRELLSLIDYGKDFPALPSNHPFDNVLSNGYYWSSTTNEAHPSEAWMVRLIEGSLDGENKDNTWHLWPVRGGR